ncbi:MAG: DUF6164 family protein [Ectothiorhodospiraceae bacterium]
MATMLLNLRHVPDDEAEEVRAELRAHAIDFYETPPNHWGISMGAIWLRHEDQREEALGVIAAYQRRRGATARAEHERRRAEGTAVTLVQRLREQPVRVLVYLAVAVVVLYLSLHPFIHLGAE